MRMICLMKKSVNIFSSLPHPSMSLSTPWHHHLLAKQKSLFFISSFSTNTSSSVPLEKLDPSPPFAYYTILQIPLDATQSQIKGAYYLLARKHHPDVSGDDEVAKHNFEAITLAYSVLRDPSEKYHYDLQGLPREEINKRGMDSVFEWEPKYSVYRETVVVDGETTELEDWFIAQGHVNSPTLVQRFKNAWIELKFGLDYFDFPWQWKLFFASLLAWGIFLFFMRKTQILIMQNFSIRKPVPLNLKWENDEIYDILWYVGARKHKGDVSEMSKNLTFPTNKSGKKPMTEMEREKRWREKHHMPERGPKPASQYSHTLYSNTRSRTLKKNKDRHKRFLKEREEERERVKKWKEVSRNNEAKEFKKRRKAIRDGFSVADKDRDKPVGIVLSAEEEEVITNLRKEKEETEKSLV